MRPASSDDAEEKRRRALLREFGLGTDLQPRPDAAAVLRWTAIVLCIAIYLSALAWPSIQFRRGDGTVGSFSSKEVLVMGWFAALRSLGDGDPAWLAWLANLTFVATLIVMAFRRDLLAFITSLFSIALASMAFFMKEVLLDQAGHSASVARLELGCHLWMAAMAASVLGVSVVWWIETLQESVPEVVESDWRP